MFDDVVSGATEMVSARGLGTFAVIVAALALLVYFGWGPDRLAAQLPAREA